jgi:hypothetical protein
MRAFWWFKPDQVAGMARPGFNQIHWFDLSFEEAVLFGWFGQFTSDVKSVRSFQDHVATYGDKISKFFNLHPAVFREIRQKFEDHSYILEIFQRLNSKTNSLERFEIKDGNIHFQMSRQQLQKEMDHLKSLGFERIVALTEEHHHREILGNHFEVHHFSIEDLNAPSFEQVQDLADIFRQAQGKSGKTAVHCMAGIGRTSTMLLASHMVLGESFESLKAQIAKQNPAFQMVGPQADFLHSVAQQLRAH